MRLRCRLPLRLDGRYECVDGMNVASTGIRLSPRSGPDVNSCASTSSLPPAVFFFFKRSTKRLIGNVANCRVPQYRGNPRPQAEPSRRAATEHHLASSPAQHGAGSQAVCRQTLPRNIFYLCFGCRRSKSPDPASQGAANEQSRAKGLARSARHGMAASSWLSAGGQLAELCVSPPFGESEDNLIDELSSNLESFLFYSTSALGLLLSAHPPLTLHT